MACFHPNTFTNKHLCVLHRVFNHNFRFGLIFGVNGRLTTDRFRLSKIFAGHAAPSPPPRFARYPSHTIGSKSNFDDASINVLLTQ